MLLASDSQPYFLIESNPTLGILLMLGAGLAVGALSSLFAREEPAGLFPRIALGGVGALSVGLLGRALDWYQLASVTGFAVAVIGAAAAIWAYLGIATVAAPVSRRGAP